MTKISEVSVSRYDLKFGTYKLKGKAGSNKLKQDKEIIAKSIGNVIVKMLEEK